MKSDKRKEILESLQQIVYFKSKTSHKSKKDISLQDSICIYIFTIAFTTKKKKYLEYKLTL